MPTVNTTLTSEKLDAFPVRSKQVKDVPSPLLFKITLESLADVMTWEKEIKRHVYTNWE